MSRFKVVSVDMFQTLVDVYSTSHGAWKVILGQDYSYPFAEECIGALSKKIWAYFNDHVHDAGDFYCTKHVFEQCFKNILNEKNIEFDPKTAAKLLAHAHGTANSYEDSHVFLENISKNYPVCLVSDADEDMILPLLERFKFDKVFISEDLQCYKFQRDTKIFDKIIDSYKVNPKEIIHIGDGHSDIIGAHRAGLTTCWLNRTGAQWNHHIKPDYIVTSLMEVTSILELLIDHSA